MASGLFKKLFRGLSRTRENLAASLQNTSASENISEESLDDLEASLLAADIGPDLTAEVMSDLNAAAGRAGISGAMLPQAVRDRLKQSLSKKLVEQK